MSRARAKARRQQKRSGKRHTAATTWWSRGLAIGVLLLIIGALGYALAASLFPADPEEVAQPLPPRVEADSAATEAADATAVAEQVAATSPPSPAKLALGPADRCRRHPRFARQLGFNQRSFLSTSAPSIKGLVLIQPATGSDAERLYQDPSWDDAGYLGHMTFDPAGNLYLFPSPRESLVDNPPEEQNTLYRVDTESAVMTTWLSLTTDVAVSSTNPYGIMGTTYDCDTHSLYVSTVAGSTASQETGRIVRVDVATAAVVAELQGIDPFGVAVYNEAGQVNGTVTKRLYFGAARAAEVYSILLDNAGDFAGQPQLELLLPDPSLKPWRIVWASNGDLIVRAMPFDYNLIATSERIEVPFRFQRDAAGLWQLVEE